MSNSHNPKIDQPNAKFANSWVYVIVTTAIVFIIAGWVVLLNATEQTSASNVAHASASPGDDHGGLPAPDFELSSLNGEMIALSDYQGQVVLVNMWATWCPPCKAEMPGINAFYEAHKDEGFVVLAVNSREDAATVDAFIQASGFSFPVALDLTGEVTDRYHASGLPTSYIIDRTGNIHHIQTGAISEEQLKAIIDPLL